MTRILAVDTSTEACSAALYNDGGLFCEREVAPQGHTRLLLPMIDRLLKSQGLGLGDLDCIAAGRGPGSFTGVRIGVSMAQGLAFGAGKPLVGISDLEVLAFTAFNRTASGKAVAAIDARMGEVYIGVYERDSRGFPSLLGEEQVLSPEKALDYVRELINNEAPAIIGTGFGTYPVLGAALNGIRTDESLPWADSLVRLALRDWELSRARPPEEVLPVYIRDQVTWKKISEQEQERQSRKMKI
ncbi:tRNA (adenosine(37)-N6)-threonylcarbamoyltransferase complex dimerization subunit type 1 TsaB [Succinimonas amylolytica]|uniref:tRNA (adenosine(37)-N6)-threonylcarbamoyltransferase complex dimerization subunit type 1 TsaB n=1 Tax=Succinimonas amylolytica TaxID=83769 RepID=UPI0023A8CD99